MYAQITNVMERFVSYDKLFKYGFNWAPMYRRTTGRVIEVSPNLYRVKIEIRLSYKNRNYAGTMFGGSMLAATDPIYMIQILQILGNDFVVWDKSVSARFKRPAKSTVYAVFEFDQEEVNSIKKEVSAKKEITVVKPLKILDKEGHEIALLEKTIYIASKKFYKQKIKARKNR